MIVLSIDTSLTTSVALSEDGAVLGQAEEARPRLHAEALPGLVQVAAASSGFGGAPLKAIGIDAVVVGRGPGSFTAVRAGLAFGLALARGLDVEALGVPSLQGVARIAFDEDPALTDVTVITDARRKEVFWASFRPAGSDDVLQTVPASVGPLDEALRHVQGSIALDPSLDFPPGLLAGIPIASARSDAAALARIAFAHVEAGRDTSELVPSPIYLRRPDVNMPGAAT